MVRMVNVNHENPVLRTFILFMQLGHAAFQYADSLFYRGNRLTTAKYIALKVLSTSGGTMTHSQLAIWTNTKRHNITTLVERMKKEGLVTTERSQKDKRFVQVRVTDEGRKVLEQAAPLAQKIVEQLMLGIDRNEALKMERLLKIMRANIDQESGR